MGFGRIRHPNPRRQLRPVGKRNPYVVQDGDLIREIGANVDWNLLRIMNLVTVAGIKLDRLFKSNSVFKRTLESYGSETEKNVRFCLEKETFLGSIHLYVNVLEQAGGEWRGLETCLETGQWYWMACRFLEESWRLVVIF
jgi:hypothetical protein